jgi:hypothetical protein
VFGSFSAADPESGRLLHRLVPDLRVYPCRLVDGGAVVLRARLTLYLAPLVPSLAASGVLDGALQRELIVDLYEPPQRVAFLKEVVELRQHGLTERQVAERLGITQPAVQRAMALARHMKQRGMTGPYLPLLQPPEDYGKMWRHHHPRYRFEPRDNQSIGDDALSGS